MRIPSDSSFRFQAIRDFAIKARRTQIKRERVEDRQCEQLNDLLERSRHITDKVDRYLWLCKHGFYVERKWRRERSG